MSDALLRAQKDGREYGVHHDSDEIPYNVNRQIPSLNLSSSMLEQRKASVLMFHHFDPSTNVRKP